MPILGTPLLIDSSKHSAVSSRAHWRRESGSALSPLMIELDQLLAQARKCRTLAGGLSNRDDVRVLEDLAREFEERARLLRSGTVPPPSAGIAA